MTVLHLPLIINQVDGGDGPLTAATEPYSGDWGGWVKASVAAVVSISAQDALPWERVLGGSAPYIRHRGLFTRLNGATVVHPLVRYLALRRLPRLY